MISVIMGVYQAADSLTRAVRSILEGSYQDLEVILVDDGSTDGTDKVVDILSQDERVRAIHLDANHGLAYCLNRALEEAKGEYIARMDADDYSYPGRLESELTYLVEHPELGFVSAAVRLVDGEVAWGKRVFPPLPNEKDLIKGNPFVHPCMLFRKEVLDKVGGYRDLPWTWRCEDYDLVLRLWEQGVRGGNLPMVLMDYNEKQDSYNRHTERSRRNEYRVRVEAAKALGWGLKGWLFALKPILLSLLPHGLYNYLHRRKWQSRQKTLA